jgi:hypothetical protein
VLRHEFDGGDHVAGVARTVLIENLQRDEPRLRCDSLITLVRQVPVASNQSRDMSAMAVTVCWSRRLSALREVVEAVYATGELRPILQTRIDDGYSHAIARWRLDGQTERSSERRSVRGRLLGLDDRILRDRFDEGEFREAFEFGHRYVGCQRIDRRVMATHETAVALQRIRQLRNPVRGRADDDPPGV